MLPPPLERPPRPRPPPQGSRGPQGTRSRSHTTRTLRRGVRATWRRRGPLAAPGRRPRLRRGHAQAPTAAASSRSRAEAPPVQCQGPHHPRRLAELALSPCSYSPTCIVAERPAEDRYGRSLGWDSEGRGVSHSGDPAGRCLAVRDGASRTNPGCGGFLSWSGSGGPETHPWPCRLPAGAGRRRTTGRCKLPCRLALSALGSGVGSLQDRFSAEGPCRSERRRDPDYAQLHHLAREFRSAKVFSTTQPFSRS